MNSLIIYDSSYGNTERVARAVAETLGEHGEARIVPATEIDALSKEELDLLVVGAPTQRHGLPEQVKDLLEGTPHGALEGLRALAFDTRYHHAKLMTGSAAKDIGKLLRGLGCRLLVPPESFFVIGAGGPLEPGEEDRARAWAARSLGRVSRTRST